MDTVLSHISEIIQLEDVPSIQMEVAVLVREFPDIRYRITVPANAVMNATANVNANINVHATVNKLLFSGREFVGCSSRVPLIKSGNSIAQTHCY